VLRRRHGSRRRDRDPFFKNLSKRGVFVKIFPQKSKKTKKSVCGRARRLSLEASEGREKGAPTTAARQARPAGGAAGLGADARDGRHAAEHGLQGARAACGLKSVASGYADWPGPGRRGRRGAPRGSAGATALRTSPASISCAPV
jgi:hypothetical protein